MKCNRTACPHELHRYCMVIWNEPSTNVPRVYCMRCGWAIIHQNKKDELKLTFEVTTVHDAEFRYPSLAGAAKV